MHDREIKVINTCIGVIYNILDIVLIPGIYIIK
jgi:hypothetical protein